MRKDIENKLHAISDWWEARFGYVSPEVGLLTGFCASLGFACLYSMLFS